MEAILDVYVWEIWTITNWLYSQFSGIMEKTKVTKDHFPGEEETTSMFLTQYFIMSLSGMLTLLGFIFILLIRKILQCSSGQFFTFSVTTLYFVEGLRRIQFYIILCSKIKTYRLCVKNCAGAWTYTLKLPSTPRVYNDRNMYEGYSWHSNEIQVVKGNRM